MLIKRILATLHPTLRPTLRPTDERHLVAIHSEEGVLLPRRVDHLRRAHLHVQAQFPVVGDATHYFIWRSSYPHSLQEFELLRRETRSQRPMALLSACEIAEGITLCTHNVRVEHLVVNHSHTLRVPPPMPRLIQRGPRHILRGHFLPPLLHQTLARWVSNTS